MLHRWTNNNKTFICTFCGAIFAEYRKDWAKMAETCPKNKDPYYLIALILETAANGTYKDNDELIEVISPEVDKIKNLYQEYKSEGLDFESCSRYAKADWLREFLNEKNK